MARGREPRSEPAERCPAADQPCDLGWSGTCESEPAPVEPGQGRDRALQPEYCRHDERPGDQAAGDAVERARVKERPSHESVRAAHELDDLDLRPSVLDL